MNYANIIFSLRMVCGHYLQKSADIALCYFSGMPASDSDRLAFLDEVYKRGETFWE